MVGVLPSGRAVSFNVIAYLAVTHRLARHAELGIRGGVPLGHLPEAPAVRASGSRQLTLLRPGHVPNKVVGVVPSD